MNRIIMILIDEYLQLLHRERALRLIEQNLIFDSLYIDEAHELFNFDFGLKHANRSLLLARLLKLQQETKSWTKLYTIFHL